MHCPSSRTWDVLWFITLFYSDIKSRYAENQREIPCYFKPLVFGQLASSVVLLSSSLDLHRNDFDTELSGLLLLPLRDCQGAEGALLSDRVSAHTNICTSGYCEVTSS